MKRSKSSKGFVYRGDERTAAEIDAKARNAGGMFDQYLRSDVTMFKPKDGENCIRILPPTWGKHVFTDKDFAALDDEDKDIITEEHTLWGSNWDIGLTIHYQIGADNSSYLCPDKMHQGDCAVCEARLSSKDEDEINAYKPSYRPACWMIDRDNEKAGPQVWPMPVTVFQEINARGKDKKSGKPIFVDDWHKGYDIVFTKTGEGLRTKYSGVEIMRDDSPLHDEEALMEAWRDYIEDNPLPSVLQYYDSDHVHKVLYGKSVAAHVEDEDEDEDEDKAPRRRARPKAVRRAEVEDEDGVEDEDEEEAPRRSRVARHRMSVVDDEDDTEEDDDAEEDGDEDEQPSASARKQLERLKRSKRARA